MKKPKVIELAENFFAHNDYNEFSADEVFVIGYKTARDIVVEELKLVQARHRQHPELVSVESTIIEHALKSLLDKIGEA